MPFHVRTLPLAVAWVIALSASAFSPLASATDLGELGTTPTLQQLHIAASDVTFSSSYFFSLSLASSVSAQATNLAWLVGPQAVFDIGDFTLSLYGDANTTPLAVATQTGNNLRLDEVLLSAGHYRFDVQGVTSGTGGGAYALAAMATLSALEPPMPSVAEHSTLALLGCGSLVVAAVARRRRSGRDTAFAIHPATQSPT